MAEKISYKNTVQIRFKPEQFNGTDWVFTTPDTFSAYLETPEVTPQQLAELPVVYGNDEYYYVKFYASEETYSELKGGKAFYIAFYWEKNGLKLVERVLVVIVPDT